jgi:hypothetical protein
MRSRRKRGKLVVCGCVYACPAVRLLVTGSVGRPAVVMVMVV